MKHNVIYVFESDCYSKDWPHAVARVRCAQCHSIYMVVVPLPLDGRPFKCPACKELTRFNRQRLQRSKKGVDRAQD